MPFLILLCLVLTQTGCTGWPRVEAMRPDVSARPGAVRLESAPSWALTSTLHANGTKIVGIGSGDSLEQATRHALTDVAARLSVSVESRLRNVYREVDGTSTETLEHVIETHVLGTRFSNWERTRSIEIDTLFWVEVEIDRGRLIHDSLLELNDTAGHVDHLLGDASQSALGRLLALQRTAVDQDRVANLVALVDALQPAFDRAGWNERRATWQAIGRSARRALVFEVRSDSASQEIARWLEAKLATAEFSARNGKCTNDESVCIDIRSEVIEAELASRYVTRIRSIFSLLEPGGNTVREIDLVGRGNSSADPARARRQAMDDLRENFEEAQILESLIEL